MSIKQKIKELEKYLKQSDTRNGKIYVLKNIESDDYIFTHKGKKYSFPDENKFRKEFKLSDNDIIIIVKKYGGK